MAQLGGTGVFVSALRDALRAGEIDLAVHSLKDLPTAADDDVVLAAVPSRADPRDALCCPSGWTLGELAPGTLVGTGSPRRAAQLRALGQELDVVAIRGNVDTRLRKVEAGEVEAVVLARAGLARIGRLDAVTEVIDPLQMLPAPGQGALAVECRASDDALAAMLAAALDDLGSRAAVVAERAFLAAVEAGCTAPVGALADVAEDELYLRGVIASLDGEEVFRQSMTGAVTDPGRSAAGLPGKCSSWEPPMFWRLRPPGVRLCRQESNHSDQHPPAQQRFAGRARRAGPRCRRRARHPCAVAEDRARAKGRAPGVRPG